MSTEQASNKDGRKSANESLAPQCLRQLKEGRGWRSAVEYQQWQYVVLIL